MAIQPGQTYRSCRPGRSTRVRVTGFVAGRIQVVDADAGDGRRLISRSNFHGSTLTRDGKPRRTGYALETK